MLRSRIGDYDVKSTPVTWDAIEIFRMQDRKIADEWVNRDELGILLSAGVRKRRSQLESPQGRRDVPFQNRRSR
jgi:hypothetical protein